MKIKLLVLLAVFAMLASTALAAELEINFSTPTTVKSSGTFANLQLDSLRYEPYPVNPGDYFTLYIKAENIGTMLTKNATFELVPKFPFSLDSNEDAVRNYASLTSSEPVVMKYKVRASKDAVSGSNELQMRYTTGGNTWITKKFDIEVDNAQTDFDLVIQETSGSEVSLAIANTGINAAESMIVKIPEQDSFTTIGTSGQMVGNLDSGDYTLVSFEISPKFSRNSTRTAEKKIPLKVEIDYTDTIGVRREVIKEIDYNPNSNYTGNFTNGFRTRNSTTTTTKIYQQWWFWLIIVAVLYAGWSALRAIKRRKEEHEEKSRKK
jgi:hypothetical protein